MRNSSYLTVDKLEANLLGTKDSLYKVCKELGIDVPDEEELCISNCTHCGVWNYNYKLKEDLDGNPICKYCEQLVGL